MQLPEGWEEVTLVAPKDLIKEFQRRAQRAREKLSRDKAVKSR